MPTQAEKAVAAATSVAAYQRATTTLRDQIAAFIENLWRSLGSYRNPQVPNFVQTLLPVIQGAEQHMAALTTAFHAQQRQIALGGLPKPLGVPGNVTGSATRNGVPPTEVYARPFHLVWREIHDGVAADVAIEHGLQNAQRSAISDLQRTKVLTAHANMQVDERAFYFRRVLEGSENCAMCVVASTQRYYKKDLLPIHPGCDCGVEPIYGENPGLVIDEQALQDAHDAIQQTFGVSDSGARAPDYRKLILIHDHGELGPTLTVRGHHFTGREAKQSGLDLSGLPRI